jgi:hypothetical protein
VTILLGRPETFQTAGCFDTARIGFAPEGENVAWWFILALGSLAPLGISDI